MERRQTWGSTRSFGGPLRRPSFLSMLVASMVASLAFLLCTSSASALSLGLQFQSIEGTQTQMYEIAQTGTKVWRIQVEPRYDTATYDKVFEQAALYGITILPLVRDEPVTKILSSEAEKQAWGNWLTGVVKRYGYNGTFWQSHPNIPAKPATAWEVLNEPNLPGANYLPATEYGKLLAWAGQLIQSASQSQAQRTTEVLFGGLEMQGIRTHYEDAQKYLIQAYNVPGVASAITGVAIHPYQIYPETFKGYSRAEAFGIAIYGIRAKLDTPTEMPGGSSENLWITEIGWPAEGEYSVGEAGQAELLKQAFDYARNNANALKLQGIVWYNYADSQETNWAGRCGLRQGNLTPRQSWTAFQEEAGVPVGPPTPPPTPPTVETKPATNITESQATLNGTVNPNRAETTYRFEYGKTTNYGSSIPVPDAGAGAGTSPVTVYLTPNTLLPRTRYHFRLVATNTMGTSYGADNAFTTGVKWSVRNSNSSGSPQVAFWFGLPGETRVSGDWDSNGTSTPGVYNPTTGIWKLRNSNTTGSPFTTFQYGGGPWTIPLVGDWDGDGKDSIGVYDPTAGNWNLKNTNQAGNADYSFQYGGGPWTKPVVGDWNGDGKDTVGVYDPSAGNWNLRDTLASGPSTYSFQYGGGPWSGAVAGDWNGDGKDSIGVYDPSAGNWNLKNTNQSGNADYSFQYGGSQYQITVGDWDGNKTDTPALSEANAPTAIEYQLRNKNESGGAEISFESGSPEQTSLAGDWNGDKVTTTGRYEPITGKWFLRTTNSAGIFSPIEFQYGGSAFKPVVGDWDGNKTETVGLYEPQEGRWELRNENSGGSPQLDFKYGGSQFIPVVGDWDGNGTDTVGLYEPTSGQWQLRNENSAGSPQLNFQFGGSQYIPVVGDWNGDGKDTVGLYEPQSGQWNLRNTNSSGPPDLSFSYGGSQFKPVVGDWDGNGTDTVGLVTW